MAPRKPESANAASPSSAHGVLPTKLRAPRPRPDAVHRSRLLAIMDDARVQPLTLVCAPAGSGKSTLVAQWLEGKSFDSAWLSLDAQDDHPASFLRGLLAMLAPHITSPDAPTPNVLGSEPRALIEWLGARVVEPLSRRSEDVVLVMDDLHVIKHPEILGGLGWLVERLPEHTHLILISRSEPDLPLARLRVRNQVTVIDRHQLRFSAEESRAFYNQTMALRLSDQEVQTLEARTEGWAAALQLFALSVRSGGSPVSATGSAAPGGQLLEQYLTDEVLAHQPHDVRRFLLRTSILDRLTYASCEAVTGEPAADMLTRIDRENLFLVPLDADGRSWRYHHLFSSLLGDALGRSNEPVEQLHRLACGWALQESLPHDAFRHAMASKDFGLATEVVLRFSTELLFDGRQDTLREWFDAIPNAAIEASPVLAVSALWARVVAQQPHEVGPAQARLERSMAADNSLSPARRREITAHMYGALALSLHLSTQADETLRYAQLALDHLDDPEHSLVGLVSYIRGTVFLARRKFRDAIEAISAASQSARNVGNRSLEANAAAHRVRVLGLMGRFAEADEILRTLLSRTDAMGHGFAVQQKAWAALCRGSFEHARDILATSLRENAYLYTNDELSSAHAMLAMGHELLGNRDAADVEAFRASEGAQGLGPRGGLLISGIIAVHRDDPGQVRATLDANPLEEFASPETRFWHRWMNVWSSARAGSLGEALERTQAEMERCEADGARVFVFFWKALQASILRAAGFEDEARRTENAVKRSNIALATALRCALPSRDGPPLQAVVPPDNLDGKQPSELEALSGRETEVLGLIAHGMSNNAIATELSVSLATVKTHVGHILRKLHVRNRTHAVRRARVLGWLSED